MLSKALVTKVKANRAEIMVMRSEACGSCNACNACHAKPGLHTIDNIISAKEGDFVIVEMEDKVFFKNIAWLYLLPLLLFVGGIWISDYLLAKIKINNEAYSLLGGFVGIFIFWVIIRFINKKKESQDMMRMIRIADPQEMIKECQ